MNDEEYPPLFQLDIVRNVGLCFAVQFQSHVEVAPRQRCQQASYHEPFAQVSLLFRMRTRKRDVGTPRLLLRYRRKDISKCSFLSSAFAGQYSEPTANGAGNKARRTISSQARAGGFSARRPGPYAALGGASARRREDCSPLWVT